MADDTNILPADQNFVRAAGFESSSTPGLVMAGQIDEITGRILVDNAGSGSGTVTSVSVVSANGFAGSVADATTTPAITISTSITGILKGNGTAISAVTIGSGLSFDGTTLSATGGSGTVTSVAMTVPTGLTISGSPITTTGTLAVALDTGYVIPLQSTLDGFANTSLSNLASVAINTSLISDTNNTDDLGSTGIRWKKTWTVDLESTNMPTVGGTSLTTVAQIFENKTISGASNTLSNIAVSSLANGTDGQLITWDSSGVATTVATGNSGQVLTSNGAGAAPTFQDSSGGTTTSSAWWSSSFETEARFSKTIVSAATGTFNTLGVQLASSATSGSSVNVTYQLGSIKIYGYDGSPTFRTTFNLVTKGTTASAFFGIGTVTVGGTGHTFTNRHIGFKVVISGSTATLYATQADNTTENATSLTTITTDDTVEVACKANGNTSVDYYYRVNNGSWSSATNLTSNFPTITVDNRQLQFSLSNDSTASDTQIDVSTMSYTR